jgi:hypothetical protein
VAEFLIELYIAGNDTETVEASTDRARRAAEELTHEGRRVRFVRSIFVPGDETCFYLYEAATAADVREAARRASLPVEDVVEAIFEPEVAP